MKYRNIFIGLVIVLTIGLLATYIRGDGLADLPRTTVQVTASELHVGTDQSIASDSEGRIYFSNGRYIVRYNAVTGQSERLSDEVTLPTISQIVVSPNSNYIAFQSVTTTSNDSLNAQVQSAGYDSSSPQWWLLDTALGSYRLLDTGAKQVAWDSQSNLHMLYVNKLLVVNSQSVSQKSFSVKNLETFSVNSDGSYMAETTDDKIISFNEDGKDIDELGDGYDNVSLAPLTNQYLSYSLDGDVFNAVLHSENEKYRLADFKEAAFAWNSSGDRLAYADDEGIHLLDTKNKVIQDYKINDAIISNVREVVLLNGGDLIIRTDDDEVYVIGKSVETRAVADTVVRVSGYEIQGFTDGNRFVVTKEGTYSQADRTNVYAEITKLGYNPDLVRIYFEEVILSEHPL